MTPDTTPGPTPGGLQRQVDLIRQQAAACQSLGSPFYAHLLKQVADDVAQSGPAASVLAGHEDDPGPSALALRLMAAVHRLVLTGRAPELAAHYPSVGGDGDAASAWSPFRSLLGEQRAQLRAGLSSPPQTNEVGRSAALFGGLLQVLASAQRPDLPVRLVEIGASAGLNLLADRFEYRAVEGPGWSPVVDGTRVEAGTPVDAGEVPVVLDPAWESRPPGILPGIEVVERLGCDLSPIDPRTEDGELSLLSCVWPDQTQRLDRLRGAVAAARDHPVSLVRSGAGDFLDGLGLVDATHTVVWHSVMWQYVPAEEQQHILDRLAVVGSAATPERTLTHLAFEPRRLESGGRHRFVVAATTWPGGTEQILGEAPPHGVPVRWGHPQREV